MEQLEKEIKRVLNDYLKENECRNISVCMEKKRDSDNKQLLEILNVNILIDK